MPIQPKRFQKGGALIDALIGAVLMVMGAIAFYSLVPVTSKSTLLAQQQTVATQIGNRMVEHLLLLKPSTLTVSSLSQLSLIDSGQVNQPYSFTNLPLDDGWNYSPAKALPSGTGRMTVDTLANGSKRVTLIITWRGPNNKTHTYTTGTVLGSFR
jgi:Tfp pilus assembly protein PilV